VAVAAGVALAATACGGNGADTHKSDNTLEVFSWWTSGSEDAALKQLFKGFEAKAAGAKIVNGAVAGGGGGNAQAVLQTRLQGNNPPDTWQAGPAGRMQQFLDAGVLADVTDVYDKSGFRDVMPKALIDSMSKGGKIYAVATGAHRGNVLWFNRKLLKQAGVNPASNYDLEQFVDDLGKLKSKGITPICLGAKDAFATAELFENTLLGVLGPDGWNELTTGDLTWDSPKVRQAAGLFAKMLPYIDPDASALTWDQATKRLAEGKCAFESMGDWAYGELTQAGVKDGKDFGYVPHPGTDGAFMLVVDAFVVAENAPDKKLAMTWLKVIGDKDVQLAFNKAKGSTPVRTDVDTSSLPPYQRKAADSYRGDAPVYSVVHGEAMNPQFQQAFFDAVTQFVQTKKVDTFVRALSNAAQS
jgi:glucose/mannose transport system substrate-binding protein